jgi:hypothetical protein
LFFPCHSKICQWHLSKTTLHFKKCFSEFPSNITCILV